MNVKPLLTIFVPNTCTVHYFLLFLNYAKLSVFWMRLSVIFIFRLSGSRSIFGMRIRNQAALECGSGSESETLLTCISISVPHYRERETRIICNRRGNIFIAELVC
jgi:hypothetical protein